LRGLICCYNGECWAGSTFLRCIFVSEIKGWDDPCFQWFGFDPKGSTDFSDLGTEITLRFCMPDDIASVCCEERNKKDDDERRLTLRRSQLHVSTGVRSCRTFLQRTGPWFSLARSARSPRGSSSTQNRWRPVLTDSFRWQRQQLGYGSPETYVSG
jgi:hypothetical protein